MEDSSTAAHTIENGRSKPWKIRLPLLILHKDIKEVIQGWKWRSYNPGHIGGQEWEASAENQWEHWELVGWPLPVPHHPDVFATRLTGGLNTLLQQQQKDWAFLAWAVKMFKNLFGLLRFCIKMKMLVRHSPQWDNIIIIRIQYRCVREPLHLLADCLLILKLSILLQPLHHHVSLK